MRTNPDALVEPLATRCGECHRSELAVWEETPHATGFDELHRKPRATEIATAMGIPLIKRDSVCLRCHYTPVAIADGGRRELRAGQGVSCQSCHGEAREWIDVHRDYGVAERDMQRARALEAPEHRAQRIAQSRANGMVGSSDLYALAAACYDCHIVSVEELVNRSNHRTGSTEFELANWSHGRMYHNFLESYLTGDGTRSAATSPERQRVMYVLGRLLELEFSLRAFARATENGRYSRTLQERIGHARRSLDLIVAAAPIPEVDEVLGIVGHAPIELGNVGPLLETADRIAAVSKRFTARHDGARFDSLDSMITESLQFVPHFSR